MGSGSVVRIMRHGVYKGTLGLFPLSARHGGCLVPQESDPYRLSHVLSRAGLIASGAGLSALLTADLVAQAGNLDWDVKLHSFILNALLTGAILSSVMLAASWVLRGQRRIESLLSQIVGTLGEDNDRDVAGTSDLDTGAVVQLPSRETVAAVRRLAAKVTAAD